MRRSLLVGGLGLILVAIVVVAIVISQSKPDQETIDLPKAVAGKGKPEQTESVKLFGGKEISVDLTCANSLDIDRQKARALAAANRLPALKRTLLRARRKYRRFLAQHPSHSLDQSDFATYESLRGSYMMAVRRFNREVRHFNRLAKVYNADLLMCKH